MIYLHWGKICLVDPHYRDSTVLYLSLYLLHEFDVLCETGILLLETSHHLVAQLTHMLTQRVAAIKAHPETTNIQNQNCDQTF